MKEAITSASAPRAIGPYSQAARVGEWLFLSGQIGLDPTTGELVPGGVEAETARILDNLRAVLAAAAASLAHVVRTTVYLVDLGDFSRVNDLYERAFRAPYPARATVGVAALPRGARVEIDAIAWLGRRRALEGRTSKARAAKQPAPRRASPGRRRSARASARRR
jgi:2-iminobutanoate/2-iminopropanoate deaminase